MSKQHIPEIVDTNDPQWVQRAIQNINEGRDYRIKNVDLSRDGESIMKLRSYERSKMKGEPAKRFDGVFDCDGIEGLD